MSYSWCLCLQHLQQRRYRRNVIAHPESEALEAAINPRSESQCPKEPKTIQAVPNVADTSVSGSSRGPRPKSATTVTTPKRGGQKPAASEGASPSAGTSSTQAQQHAARKSWTSRRGKKKGRYNQLSYVRCIHKYNLGSVNSLALKLLFLVNRRREDFLRS